MAGSLKGPVLQLPQALVDDINAGRVTVSLWGAGQKRGPAVGDYVGRDTSGQYLYVCAVDRLTRSVRIAPLGVGGGEWLNETQARAQYSYEWGAYKTLPWMARNQPTDAECAAVDVSALAWARFTYPALDTCPECGLNVWQGCACLSRYSESHVPTERLSPAAPVPTPQTCECGSGSNERGEDGCYCDGWHYGEDPRDVRLRALVSLGGYLAAAMYGQGMGYDVNDWATAEDDWQAFQDRRDGMTYRHARRKVQAILRANEAQLLSLTARVQRERDVALDPTPEQVAIAMVEVPLWTP